MVGLKQLNLVLCLICILFTGYGFARLNYSTIPCLRGPNYWCLNQTTESLCNFSNQSIGLCGYTNKRCQIKTGDEFCKSSPPAQQQNPFQFNGGLTGVNDNYFSYYILSLYWPPSSCPPVYNETRDLLRYFCSPYTDLDQPGSERLVLHGLWPTFSTDGSYQGWPQFCSSERQDLSSCHIDGNLCPWKNTSRSDFSQGDYEFCLASENIERCLVNGTAILEPQRERLKTLAPGYLNKLNLFINHEWTKHGSCCSSSFGYNISNYLTHMLNLVELATQPGSLTYESIQRYAGEKIGLNYLLSFLNYTSIINCNSKCELEELWMCMGRDGRTGLPNKLIPCPAGARNQSDSCQKSRCAYVSIPLHHRSPSKPTGEVHPLSKFERKLFSLLLILIILKLVFVLCGACCTINL